MRIWLVVVCVSFLNHSSSLLRKRLIFFNYSTSLLTIPLYLYEHRLKRESKDRKMVEELRKRARGNKMYESISIFLNCVQYSALSNNFNDVLFLFEKKEVHRPARVFFFSFFFGRGRHFYNLFLGASRCITSGSFAVQVSNDSILDPENITNGTQTI